MRHLFVRPLSVAGLILLLAAALFAGEAAPPTAAAGPQKTTPAGDAQDAPYALPAVASRMVDRGDFESAEKSFREVLDSGKFSVDEQKEALVGLARLYRKKGAFAKTAAIYEKYLQDFPNDAKGPLVMLELGRTLRAIGTHAMAISRFYSVINSTLKLNADDLNDYQVLARTAQFEIAETHFVMGNYAEAARFFSKLRLLDLAPEDRARAHFKAGYAHHLNQDSEAAARVLRDFVEAFPKDENAAEAYYLLASACWKMNRREEALGATLQLLKGEDVARGENGSKRWAYWQRRTGNQLANDFYQMGEHQSALQIYLRLAEISPEPEWRMPSLYQAALCYERSQAATKASDIYREIGASAAQNPSSIILAELAKMAAWRLEHFTWQQDTIRKTDSLFSTASPTLAPLGPESKKENDPSRSAKPASGGL